MYVYTHSELILIQVEIFEVVAFKLLILTGKKFSFSISLHTVFLCLFNYTLQEMRMSWFSSD